MQAVSGISDIGPLTFAELLHACRAKTDFEWIQTATLMAHIANCNSARHAREKQASDYYTPQIHQQKRRGVMSVDRLGSLFGVFTKRA